MQKNKHLDDIKIAFVITTYNKIVDAKGQMDLILNVWKPLVKNIHIYHQYSGKKAWYPKKYRENYLSRHKPLPHLEGAVNLINQGIRDVLSSENKYDYIVVASADAWMYKPRKIKELLKECIKKSADLTTSLWHGPFFSTEFFIITPSAARKIFPLHFKEFVKKNNFVLSFVKKTTLPLVEAYFTYESMKALKTIQKVYLIPGRRIVAYFNRYHSGRFYASHHDYKEKIEYMQKDFYKLFSKKTPLGLKEMLNFTDTLKN